MLFLYTFADLGTLMDPSWLYNLLFEILFRQTVMKSYDLLCLLLLPLAFLTVMWCRFKIFRTIMTLKLEVAYTIP